MPAAQVPFDHLDHAGTQALAAITRPDAKRIQVSTIDPVSKFLAVAHQLDEYLPDDADLSHVGYPQDGYAALLAPVCIGVDPAEMSEFPIPFKGRQVSLIQFSDENLA